MAYLSPSTRLSRATLTVLAACLAAAPAWAQPRPQNAIIVEGETLSLEQVRERSTEFVRGTGVANGTTPAARWVDPVCPRVLGLNETGARAAEARIRAIAMDAGVPVAPEGCDSNIVVSFVPDAGAIVREIDQRASRRLAEVPPDQREALLTGSMPIRWWYATEERGRHGEGSSQAPGGQAQNTPATHAGSGAGSSFGGDAPTALRYDNSLISTLTQRALVSASVLVDQDQVMGRRLDTIAAYAALVALAEIRSADFAPRGSILSLFDGQEGPNGLTAQDAAFLRALYRLPLDRQAALHRGLLVREMTLFQASGGRSANRPVQTN